MPSPFPAGQDLAFTRIQGTVVVHHPDDHRRTKTVTAQNIRKIVIRGRTVAQIIAEHFTATGEVIVPIQRVKKAQSLKLKNLRNENCLH